MVDGSTHLITVTAGDKIKAGRQWTETGERQVGGAYLAAKRARVAGADVLEFDEWIDTLADWDPIPTSRMIDEMVALGDMTEEQAEGYRRIHGIRGDETGEAPAGRPTTSPASPTPQNSPSDTSATPSESTGSGLS